MRRVSADSLRVEQVSTGSVRLDPYLDLRAAAEYSGLSVRTLRAWLTDPERPLPHYRVGGKILVRHSELDGWLAGFRREGELRLDRVVDEVLRAVVIREEGKG